MSLELKIKAATLAAEARIIRRWEAAIRKEKNRQRVKFGAPDQKTIDKFLNLHEHRTFLVRQVARSTHLARMFLKGTPYKAAEKDCKHAGPPHWYEILKMAKRYAKPGVHNSIEKEFDLWKDAV